MLYFVRPSVPQSLNRQYRGGGLGPAGLRGAQAGGCKVSALRELLAQRSESGSWGRVRSLNN